MVILLYHIGLYSSHFHLHWPNVFKNFKWTRSWVIVSFCDSPRSTTISYQQHYVLNNILLAIGSCLFMFRFSTKYRYAWRYMLACSPKVSASQDCKCYYCLSFVLQTKCDIMFCKNRIKYISYKHDTQPTITYL